MNTTKFFSVPASRPAKLPLCGRIIPVCVSGALGRGARILALATVAFVGAGTAKAATTGWEETAAGSYEYTNTAYWTDGLINGVFDPSLALEGNQTVTFGSNTVLTTGLDLNYSGSFNINFQGTSGPRTITLGGDINFNTASATRVIVFGASSASATLNVDLGGAIRNFNVGSGRQLGFSNVISNGGIVAMGGQFNFSGTNTYTLATVLNGGTFNLNGATGSSAFSDFTVNGNRSVSASVSTLAFNSTTSGNTGTTRAKSVALAGAGNSNGAVLTVGGNAGANSVDTITNALSIQAGAATVTVSPNAARNARLEAGSFARAAHGTVLFRGTDLGVSEIATPTAGDTSIRFGSVALVGAGAKDEPTIGIIKGAYGDILNNGTGVGLVTHDSTHGVRLLNTETEYTDAISNGVTVLNNVRYARATADESQDIILEATLTTINSLSFRITGAGGGAGAGVIIGGIASSSLRVNSGVIFASQATTTPTTADAIVISVPTLDLNGLEGVIIANTSGLNQGNTQAPLQINSVITNDGGNGVTIGGTGQVVFGGGEISAYTGPTVVNSGILKLSKSAPNIGIPGDLIMNGGSLLKGSNAIPDAATVTINGGTFWFDSAFSSGNNGHQETFQNLVMNGGGIGHHGSSAIFNLNGNATINLGDLTMNQGGDLTVLGTTTLNGGRLIARESSATTVNAFTTINHLAITNQESGAYSPVVLTSHATNKGGKLTITGDVTFTGNASNTNAVTIDSSDIVLANQGTIALRGTRTFDIGNGAAATDLAIGPSITDDGANVGGITKIGTGTLALDGDNLYTGPTNVNVGALTVGGSLTGTASISVAANAILATDAAAGLTLANDGAFSVSGTVAPGGVGANGTLTTTLGGTGKLAFASGSALSFDLALLPANADRVAFATLGDWLSGTGLATLQLAGAIDYAADYTVFSNVSTADFTFAAITGYDTVNYSADFAQSGSDYVLSFTAIPEPASAGLLACAAGLFAGARRFRGRHALKQSSSL